MARYDAPGLRPTNLLGIDARGGITVSPWMTTGGSGVITILPKTTTGSIRSVAEDVVGNTTFCRSAFMERLLSQSTYSISTASMAISTGIGSSTVASSSKVIESIAQLIGIVPPSYEQRRASRLRVR